MNGGYYKEDNIPCQIEEGLFLGSFGAANDEEELNRLNITHILTVGSAMPPAYPNDFVYKVLKDGNILLCCGEIRCFFKIEVVSDGPSTNIKQHFDECFDYIEEAKRSGGSVLVHCFVGRSRRFCLPVYIIPVSAY
ncbi:dual specificity protein phosphatase 1-like [Rosa rugosa]|uniref:dual specificity protein phosphatase 1-like n=1 Tax=Rosa rugosa TaxID=74645 RepID=UPI002B4167A2|nr:dual specificity protein phosphatase 1-like [Rosa rugosa]